MTERVLIAISSGPNLVKHTVNTIDEGVVGEDADLFPGVTALGWNLFERSYLSGYRIESSYDR